MYGTKIKMPILSADLWKWTDPVTSLFLEENQHVIWCGIFAYMAVGGGYTNYFCESLTASKLLCLLKIAQHNYCHNVCTVTGIQKECKETKNKTKNPESLTEMPCSMEMMGLQTRLYLIIVCSVEQLVNGLLAFEMAAHCSLCTFFRKRNVPHQQQKFSRSFSQSERFN